MATRLHLRSTTVNIAGYTASKKSTALPVGTLNDGSAAFGGPFDLSTTGGTGAVTTKVTPTLAQTAHQDTYLCKWISDVVSSGNFTAQTWTFRYTGGESSTNANLFLVASLYVLTSADAVRGYIYDSDTALGIEFSTAQTTQSVTVSGSAVSGVVSTDRLAFEVWGHGSQSMATSYDCDWNYDNSTTDSGESWIETPQAVTFGGGATPDVIPEVMTARVRT